MKPGDILEYTCPTFGTKWLYRVRGIYLGSEGQESLIEAESLSHKPGWESDIGHHPLLWIPEPLTRHLQIIEPMEPKP